MTPTLLFAAALLTGPAFPAADCGCRARVDQAQPPGPGPTPDPIGGPDGLPYGGPTGDPYGGDGGPDGLPYDGPTGDPYGGDGGPDGTPHDPPTPPPPSDPPPGTPHDPETPPPPSDPPPGEPHDPEPTNPSVSIEVISEPEGEAIVLGQDVMVKIAGSCDSNDGSVRYGARYAACPGQPENPWGLIPLQRDNGDSSVRRMCCNPAGKMEFYVEMLCVADTVEDTASIDILPPDKVVLEGAGGSAGKTWMIRTVYFHYTAGGRDLGPCYQPKCWESVQPEYGNFDPPRYVPAPSLKPHKIGPELGPDGKPILGADGQPILEVKWSGAEPCAYQPRNDPDRYGTFCYTDSKVRDTKGFAPENPAFAAADPDDVFYRARQRVLIDPAHACPPAPGQQFPPGKWLSDPIDLEFVKTSDSSYRVREYGSP